MDPDPRPEPAAFREFEIPEALAGERTDRAVSLLTGCSRAAAADAVASGGVLVDGEVERRVARRLAAGSVLGVGIDPLPEPGPLLGDPSVEFTVVHLDDDVVVVDKPAGLVVHPGPGHAGSTLVNGLVARFPELDPSHGPVVGDPDRPGLVHRLDRGTSGLLAVARTPRAYEGLVEQLAGHQVERVYTALVRGDPAHDRGVVDAPIGRSRRNPVRMTVTAEGRPARTHFEVEERFGDPGPLALLTCRLETGRTHQIRVHLHSIGHPVIGDDLYGPHRSVVEVERPFLHARELSFEHPVTGEVVRCTSPLPDDLERVLTDLRRRGAGTEG